MWAPTHLIGNPQYGSLHFWDSTVLGLRIWDLGPHASDWESAAWEYRVRVTDFGSGPAHLQPASVQSGSLKKAT